MNRPDIGKYSSDADMKILLASAYDKYRACRDKNIIECTPFLSEHEAAEVCRMLEYEHIPYFLYGGYDGAERKRVYFLPDYFDEEYVKKSSPGISYLRIMPDISALGYSKKESLSHRDYLGSVLGLGIKRGLVGDISVAENGADIIVSEDIVDYIVSGYTSTGNIRSECKMIERSGFRPPKIEFDLIKDTLASPRVDCVVAAACGVGRNEADKLIRTGCVAVSHIEVCDPDVHVAEGSVISVKGYGRFELFSLGGVSKKGRIFAEIKKFK